MRTGMSSLRRGLIGAICLLAFAGVRAQADLSEDGTLLVPNTFGFTSAAIDLIDGFAYFGSTKTIAVVGPAVISSGSISVVDLSNFTFGNPLGQLLGVDPIASVAFDSRSKYLYFGSDFGSIYRFLAPMDTLTFSSTTVPASLHTLIDDPNGGSLYAGTPTVPAFGVKLTTGPYPVAQTPFLDLNWSSATVSAIDPAGGFVYFASSVTVPGVISKVALSGFVISNTLTLPSGDGGVASLVIDTTTGFGYAGTTDSPGKVIKFSLSGMSVTQTLVLNTGENILTTAVIDTGRQYAYFGTYTSPGHIVQIPLAGFFELTPTLTLGSGENGLKASVMDAPNSFAYFGTGTTPAQLIKIDVIGGAPKITLQPRSQSVSAGQTATFRIAATGRALTYQWQREGVNISGATATSYSYGPAILADDGVGFDCVVTNSSGSVTSTRGVVTVKPVVQVFPNPWRADRDTGTPIHFTGLPPTSTVKIFTLSAHWVVDIPTTTGAVDWDRTNDHGQRVASGYYFYTVKSPDDDQTVAGKFAIIK